ncbi:MAG: hypothetical protein E4G92_01825 [Bacteroidia bacterium]|nr:MAG: hypothetical protein E4G92_01825 [Bacteroidia bacterium]
MKPLSVKPYRRLPVIIFSMMLILPAISQPSSGQNPVINKTVQSAVKNKIDNPAAIDRDITSRLNTVTVSTIKISAVAISAHGPLIHINLILR